MKKNLLYLAALLLTVALLPACGDPEPEPDPEPETVDNVTIAKENLVAYFGFESEADLANPGAGITYEKKVGAAGFTKGMHGNGYVNTAADNSTEAYLAFNVGSGNPFASMTEFTISCWVKSPAQSGMIYCLNRVPGNMWSTIQGYLDNANADENTFRVKGYMWNSRVEGNFWCEAPVSESYPADKWFHFVYSYNKATSTMTLYSNGVEVLAQEKTVQEVPLGDAALGSVSKFYIGAWAAFVEGTNTDSWMKYFAGTLDELRIYNKCLSAADVKTLYTQEVKNAENFQ